MIERQSLSNRVTHWAIAISVFGLIFSGIGQLPAYKRYMLSDLPALGWTANYIVTLWLHYFFAIILLAASVYHIAVHSLRREFDIAPKRGDLKASVLLIWAMIRRKEEPPSDKYLPEQRLAYGFIAFALGLLIVTGLIKMAKNVAGWNISDTAHFWTAQLHNLGTILIIFGVAAHLAAFLFKPNRKLLSAMFSGKVSARYVLERHQLWRKGIEAAKKANALTLETDEKHKTERKIINV
ncbi:MAG: cytochrome b/b6 domain-containing protein [Helicobacteraceae bacterium]|jgi:cytochrome b subunit of formate dehydrogenase|nr:cytochrome b/b6 domain-containing protein [Helicobacteraceae bacterium]